MHLNARLITRCLERSTQIQYGAYVSAPNHHGLTISDILDKLPYSDVTGVSGHEHKYSRKNDVLLWCFDEASALSIIKTIEES